MNIKRIYKVAEHYFMIEMDADAQMWEMMSESYSPFEVVDDGEFCDGEKLVFHMTLIREVYAEDMSLIYTNADSVEPGFVLLSVYKRIQGHYFEFTQPGSDAINGRLSISSDLKRACLSLEGSPLHQWLTFTVGVNFCFMLATACHDTVLCHASCVEYKDRAYLFIGKSGTGKSTHSRMWLNTLEAVMLMNDDHPVIRVSADGVVSAYGSPWSGKTRCYKNVQSSVGGIVRISRAPYNRARRLSPIESYASLITSMSGMTWERELADGKDKTIQSIIRAVPCWVMECLPDTDAAVVCARAVTEVWE